MADVKPIKITIEGVEKVLKSFEQIQNEARKLDILKFKDFKTQIDVMKKELESLKKSIESVNKEQNKSGVKNNDSEATTFLGRAKNRIKKEVSEIGDDIDELSSIGEKGVSTIQNIFKSLSDNTKSTSDKISDFGSSLADFASSFGLVGVAAGALITVLTPVISSLFDVSESQKALNAELIVSQKESEALGTEIGKEIVSLSDLTSVIKSNTSTSQEKTLALKTLNEVYKPYLENLGIATVTTTNLESVTISLTKAIISNAVAAAARAELEKSVGAVVAKNLDIAKVKNRQDKIALDILKLSNVAIDKNKILTSEQRNLILQNTRALGRNVSEVSDLIDSYSNLESELLLTKGNLSIVTDEANETADAFTNLDKNVDLSNIIGWIELLTGKINTIAPNTNTTVKKAVANVAVFGESVEDLTKLLESGDLSPEETEIALASLIKASNEYAKTLDNVSDKVLKASDEIKTLNDANTELFKTRAELEAQYNQSSGVLNIDALKKNVDENKRLLKELEDDYEKVSFAITEPNFDELVDAYEKKYGVVFANMDFTELQEKRIAAIKKSEKALKDASDQEVLLKQKTAIAIEEIDNKLAENKNKIINRQRLIDAADAGASVKIIQENQKKVEDLQKKFAERSTKAFEEAIAIEIAARDTASRAELEANRANLNTFTDLIVQNTQKSISEVRKNIEPTLKDFNKEFTGAFTVDDDIIVANQEVVSNIFEKGTQEQIQRFLVVKSAADLANREIRALNAKSRADIKNAQLDFAETYIRNYQTLNAEDLRFQKVKANETISVSERALKGTMDNIKRVVEERRKLGKKQSDDELREILTSNRRALEENSNYYDAKLELQFLEGGKAIAELKAKGLDTELLEREQNLIIEKILIERYEKELEIQKKYNELIDRENKRKRDKEGRDRIKTAIAITKELQNFSNIVFDIVQQNSQNIVDALNENLNLLEQRSTDVLSNIASLEDDLEGKRSGRRDAVLQSLEQQKQLEIDLAKQKIKLAQDIEKEEIKIRKREQAAAIANAIINGALAITNIFATVPKADFGVSTYVLAGISAATTAAQVALIASQKFAKGGFTGDGFQTDETGHKVAGIVHNDEWVAPKWMVESPKFGGVINQLENARTKGFADGGFTSPNFNSLSQSVTPNNTAKLESIMKSYTDAAIELSNRPIYTSVTEVSNVSNNSKRRRNNASI